MLAVYEDPGEKQDGEHLSEDILCQLELDGQECNKYISSDMDKYLICDGGFMHDAPEPGGSNVAVKSASLEITLDRQRMKLCEVGNEMNLTHEEKLLPPIDALTEILYPTNEEKLNDVGIPISIILKQHVIR